MAAGKFITFEGGEGAGKSTQAKRLKEKLAREGFDVLLTREPGGSPRAEAIREVLLSGMAKKFGPMGEALLFYAARDSHLELTIRPALARGRIVISDRFFDSTRAYQGAAGGVSIQALNALERIVAGSTRPDLTLILDLPAEEGLRRAQARNADEGDRDDRFEVMKLGFHEDLRKEFLEIAKAEPWRCAVIDSTQPPDEVAEKIWSVVCDRLGLFTPAVAIR